MSARLPSEVTDLIRRVLAGADLPRHAAEEVERDLHAHFEDGLAAGSSIAELIARFGDPSQAGRRIAEARRRDREVIDPRAGSSLTPGAVAREARRAIRSLLASPLFSLTAVATLALGVGANTAVFTVLDSVLLEPLPYADAERLVRIYETSTEDGGNEYLRGMAVLEYRKWEDVFESFGVLYTYRENGADLTEGDVPERVVVSQVDAGFFEVMGVAPLLGRTFQPEESLAPGGQIPDAERDNGEVTRVTVLSERLWRQRFEADPGMLGRPIRLDGVAFEVVGVLAADFRMPFGSTPDLWVPHDLAPGGYNSWGNHYLSGVAKLREGVTAEAAQARVDVLNAAMVEQIPDADEWSVQLVPLRESLVGDSRRTMLFVLAGAVGLVLLSACVNVSNLVFARNLGRAREIAVRSALGAGRPGLVLHLLSESIVAPRGRGRLRESRWDGWGCAGCSRSRRTRSRLCWFPSSVGASS